MKVERLCLRLTQVNSDIVLEYKLMSRSFCGTKLAHNIFKFGRKSVIKLVRGRGNTDISFQDSVLECLVRSDATDIH